MPVTNTSLSKITLNRLRRTINRHIRDGHLPVSQTDTTPVWELHFFELTQVTELGWKADKPRSPDGYVILIGTQGNIHAIAEILEHNNRLIFSHFLKGPRLEDLVGALNKASERFISEPEPVTISIAGHFLAGNLILAAQVKGLRSLFRYTDGDLLPVNDDELADDLDKLRASRKV